jgi:hypothetical protein
MNKKTPGSVSSECEVSVPVLINFKPLSCDEELLVYEPILEKKNKVAPISAAGLLAKRAKK